MLFANVPRALARAGKGSRVPFRSDFCPLYCGETGYQNALDHAQQRAHSGFCDIQVLDENWNVVETITNEDLKPVV